ncbi:MAG TPA: hypothetical protein VIU11_18270 [Nakamurella sp.]
MMQQRRIGDDWVDGDESLMASLRDALADPSVAPTDLEPEDDLAGVDPVTLNRMYAAARAAFIWRTIDSELELLSASEASADDFALVRGSEEPISRTLEFAGRIISIELEIGPDLIVGQIYPIQGGHLTLMTQGGTDVELESDEVGCFTFARPSVAPFRLRCTTADAGVITDWVCMT